MSLPESNSKLQVSFYDASGREINLKYSVSGGYLKMDTEKLASGLYFVRILADDEMEFVKITKIKK